MPAANGMADLGTQSGCASQCTIWSESMTSKAIDNTHGLRGLRLESSDISNDRATILLSCIQKLSQTGQRSPVGCGADLQVPGLPVPAVGPPRPDGHTCFWPASTCCASREPALLQPQPPPALPPAHKHSCLHIGPAILRHNAAADQLLCCRPVHVIA